MSLEKITQLASVEILLPSRSLNVAWHTFITEDGEVISGPSIHRTAYSAEDSAQVLPEIQQVISADYIAVLQENSTLKAELLDASAQIMQLLSIIQSLSVSPESPAPEQPQQG